MDAAASPHTEEFFHSVGEAFARNRAGASNFELVLLAAVVVLVALQVVAFIRRSRGVRFDLAQLAQQRGLTAAELTLVHQLARASAVLPMELLTHLDVFERATARALAGQMQLPLSGPALADSLRRVRHVLHFDRLPSYAPLLSTRELTQGTAIDVGATHGQVFGVSESSFAVDLRAPAQHAVGEVVTLSLSHAREARYQLRCRLLEVRGGTHLVFAHDEEPTRLQQREYARVPVAGAVTLRALSWPGHGIASREVTGELRDIGGGGALLACQSVLPAGALFAVTFSAGGQTFTDVRAVVLSSMVKGGAALAHLEFSELEPPERERLLAAVTRLQVALQALSHQPAS